MSRDESHGVVLTGYHSNAELLPKVGPRAPARPSAVDPEPTAPRWDKRVCAGRAGAAQGGCERTTVVLSCLPAQCVLVVQPDALWWLYRTTWLFNVRVGGQHRPQPRHRFIPSCV